MTRREFLDGLRTALGNDLSGSVIQENVDYYNGYISDEVRKGRQEEDVIAELGDPWVIARTIIDSGQSQEEKNRYQEDYGYETGHGIGQGETGRVRTSGRTSWWKRLFIVLAVCGVIMIVMTVIGGIVSLLAPIIIPVIIVMFILRLFNSRRR